ncbi:MAG: hypothetical protein AAF865_14980 [Pseudomonadota bacterium]
MTIRSMSNLPTNKSIAASLAALISPYVVAVLNNSLEPDLNTEQVAIVTALLVAFLSYLWPPRRGDQVVEVRPEDVKPVDVS